MNEYLQLPVKEKIIFIWIRHLRYEFIEHKHFRGYRKIINNIINPMEALFREKEYNKILDLCPIAIHTVKFLNGNHFHINLFIELEKLLKDLHKYVCRECGKSQYEVKLKTQMDIKNTYLCIECMKK